MSGGRTRGEIEKLRRDKMLDILRRVIANPGNAPDVANQLVMDWFPVIRINADASIEFEIGDGSMK